MKVPNKNVWSKFYNNLLQFINTHFKLNFKNVSFFLIFFTYGRVFTKLSIILKPVGRKLSRRKNNCINISCKYFKM